MPYTYDSAMRAFYSDPGFNRLVNTMEHAMEDLGLSPADLRSAAIFACVRFEQRRDNLGLILTKKEAEKLGIQIIPEKL